MNPFLAIPIGLLLILLFLITLGAATSGNSRPNLLRVPVMYVDEETGCRYLSFNGYAVLPQMDADGKQICKVH